MKTILVLSLMIGLSACSGGGSSAGAGLVSSEPSKEDNVHYDPTFKAPETVSTAETNLRGDWYSTRDPENFLKVDNAGNWSFQLKSGYYRIVHGTYVVTPYTSLSGGINPIAESFTNNTWLFNFRLQTYPGRATFDGIYDDAHSKLAIEFISETCAIFKVKALDQTTYDTYCKQ